MKSILIALLVAASFSPAAEVSFEVRVPAPDAGAFADGALQEAIDAVAAAGGGVVQLGAGEFKLSRRAGDETVVLKTGVTLRGEGFVTHLFLDPATPPNAARYYPVRIGSETTPANNVVVENLRYTGNNAKIGGGSIMGFNARLGDSAAWLLSSENITVRNCWIYDAQQAAGCTKDNVSSYAKPERLATQFRNWQVHHNFIDTCGNKAVELAECNGGLIADNYIVNVKEGPQVICGSRNVQIRDNEVWFTDTGINITEGSNHIRVSGNHVEPVPAINPGTPGGCLFFRTEPQAHASTISDVVVTGNIFRDQTTRTRRVVRFQTRKESPASCFEGISFTGNVFDGDIAVLDTTTPARTTIRDLIFANNICEGDFLSVPNSTMASSRVMVRDNMLRKTGAYILNASRWIWSGNTHVHGTLQIAAGAASNIVHDNVTTAPVANAGVGTELANNILLPEVAPEPTP